MFVPSGLNAWARLSRLVAVSSGPRESTYGFADVSRIEQPAAIAKSATRKASNVMILLAGKKAKEPSAARPRPVSKPTL